MVHISHCSHLYVEMNSLTNADIIRIVQAVDQRPDHTHVDSDAAELLGRVRILYKSTISIGA